jgi:adenylate kinase
MSGSLFSEPTAPPHPLVLILLGPPGSGKGTQAKLLEGKLQLPHISTGDLLRDHVRRKTDLGKRAQSFIESGQLGPDELVLDMLFERISEKDCSRGYILDGFPRTIPQATNLQERLKGKSSPIVINLALSDAKVIERLSSRVVCEKCGTPYHLIYAPPQTKGKCDKCGGTLIQRSDDAEAVVIRRLKVYHEQTAPLIAFYSQQKLLHTIDCAADKEQVFHHILALLPKNH